MTLPWLSPSHPLLCLCVPLHLHVPGWADLCLSLPVSEEQCLYQIYIDELYGGLQRPSEDEKKK